MREVVISSPVRTPIGSFGGALKTIPAYDLAKMVMQQVIARSGIDSGALDEVVFGNVGQPSEAANIARVSAIYAGIPQHVTAYTVQRNCASGMAGNRLCLPVIQSGDGELFLAGGTENMSAHPLCREGGAMGLKLRHTEFTDALWKGSPTPPAT